MFSTSAARRRLVALASIAIVVGGLTACVGTPKPSGSSSSPSASASDSPTPTPAGTPASPSPTPTTGTPAQAVSIGCNTLVSAQTMYDFNPNFGLDASFKPAGGTPAATAIAAKGVACDWTNQTSGDKVTIAVARPGSAALAGLKTSAAAGTPVAGIGESAYFSSSGGAGRLDVFTGTYWLVATSVFFGSAADFGSGADARTLVASAVAQLR
ncbi:arginyl-tRNA synthetase [Lacisediminihabitans profunda]|uniref:Arginyl-tRNA synthetase n=1 Tax=Lacisediminihabitans profunda TaxID=2594790 RepID=A0A5C8UMG3_9MICO|nr:arginyl-tRNA synthetase [Lacisediminihabitans profunda]TXN28559.1 arginyl-tRNA synthetase [Lacisediminihabitans profunda]